MLLSLEDLCFKQQLKGLPDDRLLSSRLILVLSEIKDRIDKLEKQINEYMHQTLEKSAFNKYSFVFLRSLHNICHINLEFGIDHQLLIAFNRKDNNTFQDSITFVHTTDGHKTQPKYYSSVNDLSLYLEVHTRLDLKSIEKLVSLVSNMINKKPFQQKIMVNKEILDLLNEIGIE